MFVGYWVYFYKINQIIELLLFIGLVWGQDEYPYFNDISKQLKFEQKKIVVQIDKEMRQVISG